MSVSLGWGGFLSCDGRRNFILVCECEPCWTHMLEFNWPPCGKFTQGHLGLCPVRKNTFLAELNAAHCVAGFFSIHPHVWEIGGLVMFLLKKQSQCDVQNPEASVKLITWATEQSRLSAKSNCITGLFTVYIDVLLQLIHILGYYLKHFGL